MSGFLTTAYGFTPQPEAVAHLLANATDAEMREIAANLVRHLEAGTFVSAMESTREEADTGRRQALANVVDAIHALALADRDGMTCEHGYNPAVCDGNGNIGRSPQLTKKSLDRQPRGTAWKTTPSQATSAA